MDRSILVVGSTVVLLMLTCSPVLGSAPLGPPTAGVAEGQWGAAFEYGYSETDIEISGFGPIPDELEDVESHQYLAQLGFGAADNWEVYVLLGVANAEQGDVDFDGDYGFAYGLGTKYTFYEEEPTSWGAMFQIDWNKSEDEVDGTDVELDYYEVTVAVGPKYEFSEQLSIYGGPFFYMLDGDLDVSGLGLDIEEDSAFGGFVGLDWAFSENCCVYAEYQFTGSAQGFGVGVGWKM